MTRPILLDLFCGAGGAAVGYHRAGFDIIGIDIEPQPEYPFTVWPADALEVLRRLPDGFAAVHASPPCQAYVRSGNVARDGRHPDLLPPVRDLLEQTGLPYIIENVPGAPMRPDLVLCGSMFRLNVRRHRWFETGGGFVVDPWVPPCDHSYPVAGVYGHPHGQAGAAEGMLPGTVEVWREAMGMPWASAKGLANAIPPAYTEHIGRQLIAHLDHEAAA